MKTTTSIKLDKDTKEKATKLAKDMGLSLSSVINASMKQFISERRIVFSIEPELNNKSKEVLRDALRETKSDKKLVGPFDTVAKLKKSLLK